MKLGDFLDKLARSAGVTEDNESLKKALSNIQVADYDLPDDLANSINTGLLTKEAAKAHPELNQYFKKQVLDGLDQTIVRIADEYALPDELKTELIAEKNSYKRVPLLISKIKDLTEKKASASKGDKAEFEKQIADLNEQVKAIKAEKETAISQINQEWNGKLIDNYETGALSQYKYGGTFELSDNVLIAKNKVNAYLKEKGLVKVLNGNAIDIQQEGGTPYYEGNQKMTFKDITDKVLATSKMLQNSTPGTPAPTPANGTTVQSGKISEFEQRAIELEAQQTQTR